MSFVDCNPVRYNDPTGHCIWDLCIAEGAGVVAVVGVVEITVLVVVGVWALSELLPGARERNEAGAKAVLQLADQASQGINALLAETKEPKPLTPDEQKKVDHLSEDLDPFLDKHPDLADEVAKKAAGEPLPYDHPGEAEQYMHGVEKDMKHLQGVYDSRNSEAQGAIDSALQKGQDWVKRVRDILGIGE